jgi:ribonuclease Y
MSALKIFFEERSMTAVMVVLFVVSIAAGAGVGIYVYQQLQKQRFREIQAQAQEVLDRAKKEAETIKKEAILQAKDTLIQMKAEFERETKETRKELQNLEKRLMQKEENLEKKSDILEAREKELAKREREIERLSKELAQKSEEYEAILQEQKKLLESIAKMTTQEAKNMLIESIKEEARRDAALMVKKIEAEAKELADKKAKEIIALAIQRYAGEYVAEKTVSVVTLPNEEMKGRIIGREGRNIRALEAITGVDLIIDDTPEAVILSAFNPVRREVARIALERLISDGRIHPARIEEVVGKVTEEIEQSIREAGEQAAFDVGVHGLHPELLRLLGKLKYRTSYAQNVLEHSLEVAFLCGIMAAELGLDQKEAKRAGLLHDIGKAVDHELEGPHALIGAELARRYGESEAIVEAIASHHDDVAPESILAVLVQAADALSGARPGARKELLETYIKRLENLEKIAMEFPGVSKAYAIQAGRELRVMVESQVVDDAGVVLLSRDIAKKIESEMTYPGQIKVTVIRETRAVEYAK